MDHKVLIDVTVIIVNYNTKELVVQCINSLKQHCTENKYEIIVIDNATYDGVDQVIASSHPDVSYIQNRRNVGFGTANNIAARAAKGKYLFFLNPDTYVKNDVLKFFIDFMTSQASNRIGVIGAFLSDQNGNAIHSYARFKKPIKEMTRKYRKMIKKTLFLDRLSTKKRKHMGEKSFLPELRHVEYVTGADMFILKELFDTIGGFDEDFFMYYEETELQHRLAHMGYQHTVISGPQIAHYISASFESKRSNSRRIMYNISEIKYIKKTHGRTIGTCYKLAFLLLIISHSAIDLYRKEYRLRENLFFLGSLFNESYPGVTN